MASGPILVLFARPPVAGRTKTRLAASIGEAGANEIYRAFLLDSIELVRRLSSHGVRPAIAWSDPPSGAEVDAGGAGSSRVAAMEAAARQAAAPSSPPPGFDLAGFEVLAQQGDDLGQRMSNCIAALLARGHDRVAILGADTPSLPVRHVVRAFELLRDQDLVLGPTTDGGYYLIGARCVVPEIFRGIPWGTPRVLEETLKVLRIFGMPRILLPIWGDVDTEEDLAELRRSLGALPETDPTARCTRAALARLSPAE